MFLSLLRRHFETFKFVSNHWDFFFESKTTHTHTHTHTTKKSCLSTFPSDRQIENWPIESMKIHIWRTSLMRCSLPSYFQWQSTQQQLHVQVKSPFFFFSPISMCLKAPWVRNVHFLLPKDVENSCSCLTLPAEWNANMLTIQNLLLLSALQTLRQTQV